MRSRHPRSFGLKAIQYEIYRVVACMACAYSCDTLNPWGLAAVLVVTSLPLMRGVGAVDPSFSTLSVFLVHVKVSANCARGASGVRVRRKSLLGRQSCQTRLSRANLRKSQGDSSNPKIFRAIYYELNRLWPANFLSCHGPPQFSHNW